MRNDYTDITLVVDRSGSMQSIKDDANGGISNFISEQAKHPGKTTLTLIEFDDKYNIVYNGVDIKQYSGYQLVPRGGTALLDAVGRSINEVGKRLSDMPESERPSVVQFVIVTDGQENSSREFNNQQIKNMIEHQQNVYKWTFDFLAANQDAFATASSIGISHNGVANFDINNVDSVYMAANNKLLRMRSCALNNQDHTNVSYTENERSLMSK